jgi:8-amino-7-oxononanoate synthase
MGLQEEIDQRKKAGLYRKRRRIDSAQGSKVKIEDQDYINFSSNDYLGLANNEKLKELMIGAIKSYGIGAGSSQLLVGHLAPHQKLEEKLSKFLNRDASLIFPTGYQANLAIASALIDSDTVVFQDKLNHASLIDAALLSKGMLVRYRHNDTAHLETLLQKYTDKKFLIMTDGVFSMDGDTAPLLDIVELCNIYNANLIVDDAHGLGVLGETGAGLLEELGLNQSQVPLLIGTFGKSFGASGAFIAGSDLYIDTFIQKARTYIYTTALIPAVAATLVNTIDYIVEGRDLRKKIKNNIEHFKRCLKEAGINQPDSITTIQPLIIGETDKTLELSDMLFDKKIIVSAVRPPTVPKNTSRLRISITALHTEEQIEFLVACIKELI